MKGKCCSSSQCSPVTKQPPFVSLSPPLTNLLDAFFVLDQQLHSRDVDVQPWALWRSLHWGVKAAVVFAATDAPKNVLFLTAGSKNLDLGIEV